MSKLPMSPRSHSHYQDLLELHISGAPLPPGDRLDLFDHIETCDQCRAMLEAEERLTARMKTIPRMVAPSDLRSRILSQAIRDHTERTTTPSEDPHLADLLASPKTPPAAPSSAPLPGLQEAADDLPFFPEIQRPKLGRLRRAWRQASPAMATGFLVVASIGALYTGQFQQIPIANQAQQLVWSAVDSALGKESVAPDTAIATALEQDITVEPSTALEKAIDTHPAISPEAAHLSDATIASTPLPGTAELASYIREARSILGSLDSSVAALARATEEEIPTPAEKASPQIAALVLKPTDNPASRGGFSETELAATLEQVAHGQPGGRLAAQDQFAMDGHRYRLYTLELPAGSANRLVQNLTPYQASADRVVVNALASQSHIPQGSHGAVRFFSGNQDRLRSALQSLAPVSHSGRNERVQVVVVE